MTDQPMPLEGSQDVPPVVCESFIETLKERHQRGIQTYGRGLQTHNGRDAGLDAWEELVDLAQYLTQLRLEHADLRDERDELGQQVAALRSEVDELLFQAGRPLKYGGSIG